MTAMPEQLATQADLDALRQVIGQRDDALARAEKAEAALASMNADRLREVKRADDAEHDRETWKQLSVANGDLAQQRHRERDDAIADAKLWHARCAAAERDRDKVTRERDGARAEVERLNVKLPCGHRKVDDDDSYGGCATCSLMRAVAEDEARDGDVEKCAKEVKCAAGGVLGWPCYADIIRRHFPAARKAVRLPDGCIEVCGGSATRYYQGYNDALAAVRKALEEQGVKLQ